MESAHLIETTAVPGGVRLTVRAKPRASRSSVLRIKERALEVAIAAPPVDGAANAELCAVLARFFDLPRTAVSVVRGTQGRNKVVLLNGLDVAAVTQALAALHCD